MEIKNSYSFLTIGKTQESTEAQEFKRYIGIGSSFVLAVNPTRKELEALYGHELPNDPEYVVNTDQGIEARITFIVKTDPESNNGIETVNRAMFSLRNAPAYNRDQTKVQVIDRYGNFTWMDVEDAKAGNKPLSRDGKGLKIDSKYHMACVGEAALVDFLKHYLSVGDVFNYVNGAWIKKGDADNYLFSLEHIKNYFKGDFSEVKEALAFQPHNKVKLLYGIRTKDNGQQYQAIATRENLIMFNSAGSKAYARIEKELANIKDNGGYLNTEFKVQELAEYTVRPTDLDSISASAAGNPGTESGTGDMPWD